MNSPELTKIRDEIAALGLRIEAAKRQRNALCAELSRHNSCAEIAELMGVSPAKAERYVEKGLYGQ